MTFVMLVDRRYRVVVAPGRDIGKAKPRRVPERRQLRRLWIEARGGLQGNYGFITPPRPVHEVAQVPV